MAVLKGSDSNKSISLGHRCLVGRAPNAQLRLKDDTVSAEHAAIYYQAARWHLRDLASSNGTALNGRALTRGASTELKQGDELTFGYTPERWRLDDASQPGPSAYHDPQQRRNAINGVLWLPNEHEAEACVTLAEELWLYESQGQAQVVTHGARVTLNGNDWCIEVPDVNTLTTDSPLLQTRKISQTQVLGLDFRVSKNEEHIALHANYDGESVDLGARAHNYPLLLLTRARAEDEANGLSDEESGWLYPEELRNRLGIDRKLMNLLLWRATQFIKQAGLPSERLVERRPDSRQVRLGAVRCSVTST